jgi:acetyl esterase/lipase
VTDVGAVPAALDPELDRAARAMPDFGAEARLDDLALIRSLRDTPAMLAALGRSLPGDDRVAVENLEVPGRTPDRRLLLRVYRPGDADGGALLFLHGGAYVLGDVYVEEQRCLHLAAETGAVVVSVAYAMLDDRMDSPSMQLRGTPLFSRRAAADAWGHYLGGREADELAAPARAESLVGLPPAYLMVADQDPLRDEGIAYAVMLTRAGVGCELHLLPGTFHGFDLVCPRSALGRRALEEQAVALRRGLALPERPVGRSSP